MKNEMIYMEKTKRPSVKALGRFVFEFAKGNIYVVFILDIIFTKRKRLSSQKKQEYLQCFFYVL